MQQIFKVGDRVRLKKGYKSHWTCWYQGTRTVKWFCGRPVVFRKDIQTTGCHVRADSDCFELVSNKNVLGGKLL